MSGEKRPSADPGKKAKNPKKKKEKDPNEPQKPVSAYALFFRDTQAAIKGQNPSATFGDVSKIVASMWDSLGEEQKQVNLHPFLGHPPKALGSQSQRQTWKVQNQAQPLQLEAPAEVFTGLSLPICKMGSEVLCDAAVFQLCSPAT